MAVFASVFYLPPPRALNYLINEAYKKPTCLLTGGLDPLNDAKGRTSQLSGLVPDTMVIVCDAGMQALCLRPCCWPAKYETGSVQNDGARSRVKWQVLVQDLRKH